MNPITTFAQFDRLVRDYPSSPFETTDGITWIRSQERRHFAMLETYGRYRRRLGSRSINVLDVGAYPGTLLKSLRLLCQENSHLIGCGLEAPADFVEDLRRHEIEFVRANLDPIVRTADPAVEALPRHLPLDDAQMDFVFCTEALEHMLDPMHALREIHRVLAPQGLFLLTTPNQAKIGNRIKLCLLGRSIYYPLKGSVMYGLTNWRPHMREYTMREMSEMVADAGFRILERRYLDISEDDDRLLKGASIGLQAAKLALRLFTWIPSCRHTLLMVVAKAPVS